MLRRGPRALLALLLAGVLLPVYAAPPHASAPPPPVAASRMDDRVAKLVTAARGLGLETAGRLARRMGHRLDGDHLLVTIEPEPGRRTQSLDREAIETLGGQVVRSTRRLLAVRAPLARIPALSALPGVGRVRLPYRGVPAGGAGGTISQAVELVNAAALQAEGLSGAGVKVAVIDLSFGGFAAAQATGDLPGDAVTLDLSGDGFETGSSHGTDVAQLLYDIAPGVTLHAIRIDTLVELEAAAEYVGEQGIQVVNLSVAFTGASYYDDTGPVNDVVNDSHDNDGVFWAVAAGNWAEKHWRGAWSGSGDLEFAPGDDRLQLVQAWNERCVSVTWDQFGQLQKSNLDLFIYDKDGDVVSSSTLIQTPLTDPFEHTCHDLVGTDAPYTIGVTRVSGAAPDDVTIFSLDSNIEHFQREASQLDPAVAHGAVSVGAVSAGSWETDPVPLRSYSSRGPTNDGRIKPEITAPDGVATQSRSSNSGTSFASPSVAGGAALLLEQDPTLTPEEIEAELVASAEDVGDPGQDNLFGHGLMWLPLLLSWDSDGDTVPNLEDNCSHVPNVSQDDSGGIGGFDPDGIGDVCQCGDVTGDGAVTGADVAATRAFLAETAPLPVPERCNVRGPSDAGATDCEIVDAVVIERTLQSLPQVVAPGIQQVCAPALP